MVPWLYFHICFICCTERLDGSMTYKSVYDKEMEITLFHGGKTKTEFYISLYFTIQTLFLAIWKKNCKIWTQNSECTSHILFCFFPFYLFITFYLTILTFFLAIVSLYHSILFISHCFCLSCSSQIFSQNSKKQNLNCEIKKLQLPLYFILFYFFLFILFYFSNIMND